jgi:hypothetical protein
MLPTFIIIWKDLTENKIYRTRTENKSKYAVKLCYDSEKFGSKLLYLFLVKTIKYGSVSVSKLHK